MMSIANVAPRWIIAAAGLFLSLPAAASLIIAEHDGPDNPDPLGGFDMVLLSPPTGTATDRIDIDPLVGEILIQDRYGNPLFMNVTDAYGTGGSGWWEYDHGNVYTTSVSWIELIMPAAVRAVSFHVGASGSGNAWVQARSGSGELTDRHHFTVGADRTQGISVHSSDACGSISSVTIEPWMWGFGNLAVSQGSCSEVPEPGTFVLLAGGLFALGLLRVRKSQ